MTSRTGSTEQTSDQPVVTTAGVERPTRSSPDVPPRPVPRWRDALLVATVTAMLALIPLLFNRRFYFYDDTQAAGWGIWYHTGQRLRTGDFAFLDLHTWPSGNLWAEGQWGFLSPFSMILGLGSSLVGDLGLYSTVVKILFLCFTGVGAYLLATAVGALRLHSVLVGFLAPMAGCVVYLDTSSWFSGLQAWGWLIWLWLSLLKLERNEWGYLPAAGFIFLLATVGYAHATMMCGFLIGAFLLYAIAVRAWRLAGRFLVLGLYTLIVTAPVLLPGILTAPVTTRNTAAIANSGFFGPDLSDAAMATTLTGGFDLANFTGPTSWQPLMYVAWALPLLWIGWRSRNHDWRMLGPTLIFTGLVCLYIFGPTEFGPVRWPVRVQPYLALAVLIALVSSSHGGPRRPRLGPDTAAVLLALPLVGAWLAFADSPTDWRRDVGKGR